MLAHDSLYDYYRLNHALMYHHDYSLTELESMLPWEREIYVTMLVQQIREEKEMRQLQQQQSKVSR